jgi:hypothetical protein
MISSSQRPVPDNTHNTHNKRPCPQWDTNPQSQQTNALDRASTETGNPQIQKEVFSEAEIIKPYNNYRCTITAPQALQHKAETQVIIFSQIRFTTKNKRLWPSSDQIKLRVRKTM